MVVCPIDERCALQISALLQPPSALQLQEYFKQLLSQRQCLNIEVLQRPDSGKGVYARDGIGEGQLILQDHMLVGAQHTSNKIDCLVCSFCFRFIGSIELQIGRRLFLKSLGVSVITDSSDEESNLSCPHPESEANGASCSSKNMPLCDAALKLLMSGQLQLPHSNIFSLHSVVACPGECGETYYCSKSCAEADWEHSHSLLCTGDKSLSVSRKALLKFIQHANDTNDIFLLAAKAISFTISRYRKLKTTHVKKLEKAALVIVQDHSLSLLLDAWKPISVGYKQRWWDCVALPEDVDASEEATFRMQIRELAFKSLQLLKEAIFDKECEPLFSLEIYGQIIGMFELNNLDLIVASPVEDYFLYIDDLPYLEKGEAEKVTQPYLDSLGDDYSVSCQGTAFYPLQSCMNHSCRPNAKAFKREEDRDGRATIIALKPICNGEEVTISYIDEDLPFKERQALLADYGFECGCKRCKDEIRADQSCNEVVMN